MKNFIQNSLRKLPFLFLFLVVANAVAQTPIIKDLQTIINDRPNEFKNLQKELTNDNVAAGFKEYTSKIENLSFNRNLIINGNQGAQYLIIYNLAAMTLETKSFFDQISNQYFDEIDAMGKTGNYMVRDYKSNDGTLITEVKSSSGDKILEYRIKPTEHLILIVGTKK